MPSQDDSAHREISTQEGQALAMKLELLATVAQATLSAILHVVDERRSGELNADLIEKVANVRSQVATALDAVDDYMDRQGEAAIDLGGLHSRLGEILRNLDQRMPNLDGLPS